MTNNNLFKIDYEYGELNDAGTAVDTSKNIGMIARTTTTIPTTSFTQTFKYDAINRLTEARELAPNNAQNWKQTFGYDIFGNRNNFTQIVGTTTLASNAITKPTIDQSNNQFTTGQGYLYDFNGNLIQDAEGRSFKFDGNDKQIEVKQTNAPANSQPIGTYFYDASGARVKKVTQTETTVFVYDAGGALAAEYSTATPTTLPTTSYMTTDHLGSPRVITDKNGQVVSRRDFMPFGEEIYAGVGGRNTTQKYGTYGSDNIRKRYTGYEKDDETQLDFAQARMYQNKHGRFTAVDPLMASASPGNPQTFNRYTYTGNNPINYTDPSGLNYYSDNTTGKIKWIDGDGPQAGYTDITGQETSIVVSGCTDGGCASANNVWMFNANKTITFVRSLTDAEIAQQTRTEVIATADEILTTDASILGTIGADFASAYQTLAENNGLSILQNLLPIPRYDQHTERGQNIGNGISIVQGAFEIGSGLGATVVGGAATGITSPLCATVVGCVVPAGTATITAAGLAEAAHGAGVIVNTVYNSQNNQGDGSRSGGNKSTDFNPAGRSKIQSGEDAMDQLKDITIKQENIRKGKGNGIVDIIGKSKQQVDQKNKSYKTLQDAIDDYDIDF